MGFEKLPRKEANIPQHCWLNSLVVSYCPKLFYEAKWVASVILVIPGGWWDSWRNVPEEGN